MCTCQTWPPSEVEASSGCQVTLSRNTQPSVGQCEGSCETPTTVSVKVLSANTEQSDALEQDSWLASPGSADEVAVAVVTGNGERDQLWPPSVVTRASPGKAFAVGLAAPCSGPAMAMQSGALGHVNDVISTSPAKLCTDQVAPPSVVATNWSG